MTEERKHQDGGSMSERIACTPGTLDDLPVGMWEIVYHGRYGFEFDDDSLAAYIYFSICALMDAGAQPVAGGNKPNQWELQTHYGDDKEEVAKAVVREWQREGKWTPEPWTGLWFGLPWCYSPDQKEVDWLDPHARAGNREIRIVTPAEFERIRIELMGGARRIEQDPRYHGVWYHRQDDSIIGLRLSRVYGLTLDVIRCDNPDIPPGFRLYQR
jgi:hypothetical protein